MRLDEQLDADEPAPVRELRELLDPEREDAPFQRHYGEWIQASPEVAYAHCTTQQLLAAP